MARAMEETYLTIYKKHTESSQRAIDAIRDLILKVGEWQKRAKKMLPKESYVCDGNEAADLITEIRDYGKERP